MIELSVADTGVEMVAMDVVPYLESHLVEVTIPSAGVVFVTRPTVYGLFRGSSIVADLNGLDQKGQLCQVSLSREQLDRGCARRKFNVLECRDAAGVRIELQFFEPALQIGS